MKLWTLTTFYAVSILILSGCGATPKPNKEPVVDSTLPIVTLTDHGVVTESNAVAFEWKSISDQRVKGIFVYKVLLDGNKTDSQYYDTVKNRFVTHYVDTDIQADTKYAYAFKTFSEKAESLKSKTTVLNTLPILDSVSWIHSVQNMPRSAKIIWRPHTNQKVKAYIIERRTIQEKEWQVIATVDKRLSAEYIDDDLKDKFVYKYRVRVLTYDGITSSPSQIVKVVTKALPKEVDNITATRDLPKKIVIKWDKTKTKDFSHYNLYRSESVDSGYEVIAKLKNNYFTDKCNEDAKQYFYRVSVVDKDELESEHSKKSIQGLTLVKPTAPSMVEVKFTNGKVKIIWDKVDPRTKTYTLSKRTKDGWFDEKIEEIESITQRSYLDKAIEANKVYYYKVYAVDKNDIKSEASIEVEFKPEIKASANELPNTNVKPTKKSTTTVVKESDTIIPIQDFN